MIAGTAIVGATALIGCLFGPSEPYPIAPEPLETPAAFADYRQRLEDCAGLKGDPRKIVWYRVDRILFGRCADCLAGFWDARDSAVTRIYIVAPRDVPLPRSVVDHEMLHELLYQNGVTDVNGMIPGAKHGHPRPPYGKCAT